MSGEVLRRPQPRRSHAAFRRWPQLALLAAILAIKFAFALEPRHLTERDAIALALARPAYLQAEQARIATAQSAVLEARLLPNPVLHLDRERSNSLSGRPTESKVQVSETFDISGRRALRREASERRLDAARWGERERRLMTIAEVRRAFADAQHRQRAQELLKRWLARIDSAVAVVDRLVKGGEASGYDRRRLGREAEIARARLASARAASLRASDRLAGFLGVDVIGSLAGDLLPDAPPLRTLPERSVQTRPEVLAIEAQADAFDRERRAAERAWFPDFVASAGQNRIAEPEHTDHRVTLALSFPLPLFDRGQARERRAAAEAQRLRAERSLVAERLQAELRGVWREAVELHQVAATFNRDTLPGSRDLSRIAETAYQGGEGSLLELLDAYRAELDAENTALDLDLRARLARIELDALSGVNPNE